MYLTCGFKSIYFSLHNCFSTKHVICLICEHLAQLLISMNRVGRGHRVKTGPSQVSRPGEPEHAQMREIRCVEAHTGVHPHSLLAKTRDRSRQDQELREGSVSKKHKRDQAVTQGQSLSSGLWMTEGKGDSGVGLANRKVQRPFWAQDRYSRNIQSHLVM